MPVSVTLSKEEIGSLRDKITAYNLQVVPVKSEYELLRVDDAEVLMILYKSGKLVHDNGHIAKKIVGEVLETQEGYDFILGTDEGGKGEWYGPLVVGSVALKPEEILILRKIGVRDSKTLSRKKIRSLAERIRKLGIINKPIVLMPETYNRVYSRFSSEGKTLNDLMAWAHARALKDLVSVLKYDKAKVVIDLFDEQKMEFRLRGLDRSNLEIIQKTRAESETSVAAASILAKDIFEDRVDELDNRFQIDLRNSKPGDIVSGILPKVAKLHFKNVGK